MDAQALLAQLNAHIPFDSDEAAHRERILHFLATTSNPFSRTTQTGHVTGSAVVWDRKTQTLLLLWHVKLQRWLQPGGHCEPLEDTDTLATAWRELLEESEVERACFALAQTVPFDVDVHEIPARGDEPTHFHYDIRYLFTLEGDLPPMLRAVPLAEVAQFSDASLARLAKKLSLVGVFDNS
jgi:8-oxo-dGTP pyrophosphatase MutT (NUDIX family)